MKGGNYERFIFKITRVLHTLVLIIGSTRTFCVHMQLNAYGYRFRIIRESF